MQSSFYPYLYRALEEISVSSQEIKVIDISKYSREEVIAAANAAQLIVIDHSIHMSYSYALDPVNLGVYTHTVYRRKPANFYLDIWERLLSLPGPKKVMVLACDLHALLKEPTERLDGLGKKAFSYLSQADGLAWIYRPEHMPSTVDVVPDYQEVWMKDYANPQEVGRKVVESVSAVIELPLCVHPKEMIAAAGTKKWDISILGAGYKTRAIAQAKVLADGRFSLAPYERLMKYQNNVLRYLTKTNILGYKRTVMLKYWYGHFIQEKIIRESDTSFVCGSALKYFVRKFYEVPAGRCLMLGYMPDYAADLGFIDKENYLACMPEEVVTMLDWAKAHPEEKNRIKQKGYELIAAKHTSLRRAEQFVYALTELCKAPYRKAKFVKGDYVIER